MKSIPYVVLRSEAEPASSLLARATTASRRGGTRGAAPKMKVAVNEIKPGKLADLHKDKSVIAVAPVMRMKLIKPVSLKGAKVAKPADADAVAWGIKAVKADASQFDGAGVVVAVLDTGIDPSHPAFAGVTLKRRNFTGEGDDDGHGHGTHCAGTIFGRTVAGKRIGVAPGITKALIGKVLGESGGGSDMIAQAIQWAVAEGANVVSMSLGIDFPGAVDELKTEYGLPTNAATSIALEGYRANVRLFERLASLVSAQAGFAQAVLLTAAAGNESDRPDYVIAASPPAVADGFVSVAAVGQSPQGFDVAYFSNTGARVSAPGVGINSAKPGGGYTLMNGTSMATPHVAGVAALWAQKLMDENRFDPKLLESQLIAGASTKGFKAGLKFEDIGAGMVQAP